MLDNPTWYAPVEAPAKTKPCTAREALLAAARWIEEHGHSQTGRETSQDRYCPVEAIFMVADRAIVRAAVELLDRYVRRFQSIGITYWNARTSEDEVIATMRRAAQ